MPKILYRVKRFREATLQMIREANRIIEEYIADGYTLTVRQLHYQFVSRDLYANTQKNYDRLGGVISDARLAGLVDWNAIEDRTRAVATRPHWSDPGDIVKACASQFAIDKWKRQTHYVEVWVEKEALAGVFERVCRRNDVSWLACRGYISQSEMWRAAGRFRDAASKECLILHFGDHDPSGLDMTRDIRDRLNLFRAGHVEVRRVALNFDQVQQYNPPPNFAKTTDSRFANYQQVYGDESWELDALEPKVLVQLVDDALSAVRDGDTWLEDAEEEQLHRRDLRQVADYWQEAVDYVEVGLGNRYDVKD